ncbi:MAG: MFS transporter [Bacillota bacterium]
MQAGVIRVHFGNGLVMMVLSHVMAGFSSQIVGPLAPFFSQEFGYSRAQLGTLTSAFFFGYIISSVPFGWLIDRYGVKRVMISGLFGLALGLVGLSLARSYSQALFAMCWTGVFFGSVNPATTKAVIDWFDPRHRATAMGIKQTGHPLGAACASYLLPLAALTIGWKPALYGWAVLGGIVATTFFLFYPGRELPSRVVSSLRLGQIAEVLDREMLLLSLAGGAFFAAQFSVAAYFTLYLTESMSLEPVVAGSCLALSQLGGVLGRLGWGRLADRARGLRRAILGLIAVSTILLSLVLAVLPEGAGPAGAVLLSVITGASAFGWPGVMLVIRSEMVSHDRIALVAGLGTTIGASMFRVHCGSNRRLLCRMGVAGGPYGHRALAHRDVYQGDACRHHGGHGVTEYAGDKMGTEARGGVILEAHSPVRAFAQQENI